MIPVPIPQPNAPPITAEKGYPNIISHDASAKKASPPIMPNTKNATAHLGAG